MDSDNLGDHILQEYIKGISRDDIIEKLNISEQIYTSWEKINKTELSRIDEILEKRRLNKKLKIKTIPIIDSECDDSEDETVHHNSHNISSTHPRQFLKKEPRVVHEYAQQISQAMEQKTLESEKLIQLGVLTNKYNDLQEKINKLIDLESQKRIGKHEYNRATTILNEELNAIKSKIEALKS
jgi:ribosome-binding protein aMBF1 (putative translation factor)